MTIRARLGISFIIILGLFALNLGIYSWSNRSREAVLRQVREALVRRDIVTSVSEEIDDKLKQVNLLNSVVEYGGVAMAPEQVNLFENELKATGEKIDQLKALSTEKREDIQTLQKTFEDLRQSWVIFYQNFGVDQAKAITELVMNAEPRAIETVALIRKLRQREATAVDTVTQKFEDIQVLTDRLTTIIFFISLTLALGTAYFLSRYLTRRLGELQEGAILVGQGNLEHRIDSRASDELGQLAQAFDEMTEGLFQSQTKLTQANLKLEERHKEVKRQRELSDSLLHNILPSEIARELQSKGVVQPKYFEDVSILFTDFVGFNLSIQALAAEELVHVLQGYFTEFDRITERYGLEKLKTIGDAYMCAGGLSEHIPSHAVDIVLAAHEMVGAVKRRAASESLVNWAVRIGIHTGPVIAGVVGIKKFAFDVWGDTVNLSSRMESSSVANRINVSRRIHSRIKDFFDCEFRGEITTKDGVEEMYFVEGIKSSLREGGDLSPFLRRYEIYFQKDPPALPPQFLVAKAPSNRVDGP